MKKFMSLLRDEEGATAIEYGLIAGLIAVVIIAAVTLIGGNLSNEEKTGVFDRIGAAIGNNTTAD